MTHPRSIPGEAGIINQLFSHGLTRLHVRKPEATEAAMSALLQAIDPQYHSRMALHQHHHLAKASGITGLHFTEQNRLAQHPEAFYVFKNSGFTLSTSIHDVTGLERLPSCFDYVMLGPVFDSISKAGYVSKLPAGFQLQHHFPGKVIALGGIDAKNLQSALEMGFDGVAVLGTIWQDPEQAINQFQQLQLLQSFSSHH